MSHKPPESPLKSLLWLWQKAVNHKNKEAGNTLIIAISLGVLLVGATSTMVFTSSRNKTNVTSDEMSVRAQEVAELGITRTHNFLATNPRLAEYPLAEWSSVDASGGVQGTFPNSSSSNQTCSNLVSASSGSSSTTTSFSVDDFENGQAVNGTNLSQGAFKLSEYNLKDRDNNEISFSDLQNARNSDSVVIGQTYGFGEMIVRASVNPNASSVTELLNEDRAINSKSQIRVLIPLIKPAPIQLPGVWISDQSITSPTNSQIDATLLAPSCDNIGLNITPGNDAILSSITFPALPSEPIGNPNYYNLNSVTTGITLPRIGDQPTRIENFLDTKGNVILDSDGNPYQRKVYEYKVNDITYNGSETLTIIPGRKVILHLHGNISLGGSQTIKNTCHSLVNTYSCNTTTKVVTYNSGEKSLYRNSNLVILGRQEKIETNNPRICLNGGAQIFGFVFAPDYSVGASGTGSGNGFIGAVWARQFNPASSCGSDTGQVVAIQEIDDWNILGMGEDFIPGNLPPRIGSVSQWQREGVN